MLDQMSIMVLVCSDQAKGGAQGRGGTQGCSKGAGEVCSKEARCEKIAEGEQLLWSLGACAAMKLEET